MTEAGRNADINSRVFRWQLPGRMRKVRYRVEEPALRTLDLRSARLSGADRVFVQISQCRKDQKHPSAEDHRCIDRETADRNGGERWQQGGTTQLKGGDVEDCTAGRVYLYQPPRKKGQREEPEEAEYDADSQNCPWLMPHKQKQDRRSRSGQSAADDGLAVRQALAKPGCGQGSCDLRDEA